MNYKLIKYIFFAIAATIFMFTALFYFVAGTVDYATFYLVLAVMLDPEKRP